MKNTACNMIDGSSGSGMLEDDHQEDRRQDGWMRGET